MFVVKPSKYSNPVNLKIRQKLAQMSTRGDLRLIIPKDVNYDPEQLPTITKHLAGFTLNIEFPKGSCRRGVDSSGTEWSRVMPYAYGEFASSYSVDGDPLDVYLGDCLTPTHVYVMHMAVKGDWERYDEDKVMLGFSSLSEATSAFLECYGGESKFLLAWSIYTVEDFRRNLPIKSNSKSIFTENIELEKSLIKRKLRG